MIGTIRMHKGQRYWVSSTFMHERADGTTSVILVWASLCHHCGDQFEFTAPAASARWQPNRRCQRHKRPGSRVRAVA